ncbi:hypothetical protein [Pontibacter pamirensis]|uniref:hypothetical protein n=1 Tax=Pontibacter pamirensis TaxID=2562824 RepID=UPI001389B1DE|nr:hypothetical protein [Pontibacter pamirensis]
MNWTNLLPEGIYEYESPCLHVWVDSNLRLMHSEWLAAPSAGQFRAGIDLSVEWAHRMEIGSWIQDSRGLEGVSAEQQRWALGCLAQAVVNSKLRLLALVNATGTLSKAAFEEEIKGRTGRTVETGEFKNYKDAADWIANIRF